MYRAKDGTVLKIDAKCRRDNMLKVLASFEKKKVLVKVGSGKKYSKEYLEYEVKNRELWNLLIRSYKAKRNSSKVIYEHLPINYYMCLQRYLF